LKYCLNFDINVYVYSNLQIIVRTRGLGRVLGRVIGKVIGREDNRDLDETPQRQRPKASARRQRKVATFAKDVPHVDDAVEEVFQQLEEAAVDDQDFPCGPCDTSVLTAYADHVAVIVWN